MTNATHRTFPTNTTRSKGGNDMKVIEMIGVLRLYQVDALLLELLERLLGALVKKLTAAAEIVRAVKERLKAKNASKQLV